VTKQASSSSSKTIVLKVLKTIVLLLLIFISFASVGIAAFTYQNPQLVSDRLRYLVPAITPAPIDMKGLAILGDSQSDEYRADDWRGGIYADTTLNWVELLARKRNVNVGEWGSWGEPRRDGYSQNWAHTGATAHSLIESGQHIGAAEQIKKGEVNVVVIYIGALDFAPYMPHGNYEAIYNGNLSEAGKKIIIHRVIADIQTAVYTLEDAGDVRIVLVKIPDWSNHLGVKIAFPLPQQRLLVTNAVNDTNDEIESFAQEENLLTIDPNDVYKSLFSSGSNGQFTVDGVAINRVMLNNNPNNFYLEDGIHTGTVVNGFIANAIVEKLNTVLVKKIRPFTQKEIREAAGL
jgi:phospholipase/lecithinase/hemolysin